MTISFAHLTLILLLHYLVKCRSHILAVYNSEFILGSACVGSENHCETTKALKICYSFNINPDIRAASGSELLRGCLILIRFDVGPSYCDFYFGVTFIGTVYVFRGLFAPAGLQL